MREECAPEAWHQSVEEMAGELLDIACERIMHLERPAYIKDSELRFVAVNAAYARLFGRAPDEFHGLRSEDVDDVSDRRDVGDCERRALVFGTEETALFAGDGWFDDQGRLWFCGRKSQRVVVDAHTTLCTEQVEPVFNTHPQVRRCALVGVGPKGAQVPVLCVELAEGVGAAAWPRIAEALRQRADGFVHTAKIAQFLHYPKPFPVDIRHNAKIGREALAAWAARQLRQEAT